MDLTVTEKCLIEFILWVIKATGLKMAVQWKSTLAIYSKNAYTICSLDYMYP